MWAMCWVRHQRRLVLIITTTTIIIHMVIIIIITIHQVAQSVLLFCQGIGLLTSISFIERTVMVSSITIGINSITITSSTSIIVIS